MSRTRTTTPARPGPGAHPDAVIAAAGGGALDSDDYGRQQRRFHHLLASGFEPGPYVLVAHALVDDAQVPSGARRRDLGVLYTALRDVLDEPELLDLILGSDVDPATLIQAGIVVEHHDDDTTVARIACEGSRDWPAPLGGPRRRGEIERWVTITARRAGWRDRQVRRLARVTVESVELHPDPVATTL